MAGVRGVGLWTDLVEQVPHLTPPEVDVAEEKSADGVDAFEAEAPASGDPEGNQGGDAGSDIDMEADCD